MIDGKTMKDLENTTGQNVTVKYVWFGEQKEDQGILSVVRPYNEIELKQDTGRGIPLVTYIPFIGSRRSVEKITGKEGVLYENPFIQSAQDLSDQEIYNLALKSFGAEIGEKFRPREPKK